MSSGTANTTSRGPSCAMRTTGVPAATTWPGSASMAVTTPDTSATSVGVAGLVALRRQLRLGLLELGLRGLERGLAALQFGAADEVLVLQRRGSA